MRVNIIFVCTSNVCRSPMAEGLAKKWLSERQGVGVQDLEQLGYKVRSRGISTDFEPVGSPASPHGVAIMREKHGVDMTAHCSALLSQADVLEATHIYCMAPRHHDAVRTMLPSASVASSLSAAEGGKSGKSQCSSPHDRVVASVFNPEIPDPWHGTIECYRECAERISEAVKKALEQDMPLVQDSRQQQQQVRLPASTRDQE